MSKRKKGDSITKTLSIQGRSEDAREIELERLEITRELEQLMKKYAKITGQKDLAKRKHKGVRGSVKVGEGANDFDDVFHD